MTQGSAIKNILLFAFPMLIGNLFQQLYNVVDSTIVGRYIGADALAAVGTTGSCTFLLLTLIFGMVNGAGIIIAQCVGARDFCQMRNAITALIYIGVFLSAAITVAGWFFAEPILRIMNTPPEIMDTAVIYMRINFLGTAGAFAYNTGAAILRSFGDSKTSLYMLIISSIINIALDILFVVQFNMGVPGVAVATTIATFMSAFICVLYIYRHKEDMNLSGMNLKPKSIMIFKIIKTGIPSGLQSSMISIGNMCVQGLINSFGAVTMAAYTASSKIDSVAIQVVMSIAMSLSVYSSQNMGAGNIERIKMGLKKTLVVMIGICTVIAALVLTFKSQLLSIFLDPVSAAEATAIGCTYLTIIGVAYIICGVMQCFQNLIKGAGDINIVMAAGIVELLTRVGASYLFVRIWGVTGLWIAIPVSWGSACLIPVIRYFSGKWINKRDLITNK